jgi:hypothetical protein
VATGQEVWHARRECRDDDALAAVDILAKLHVRRAT